MVKADQLRDLCRIENKLLNFDSVGAIICNDYWFVSILSSFVSIGHLIVSK